MLKWIFLLLVAAGIYLVVEDWSSISSKWSDSLAKLSGPAQTGSEPSGGGEPNGGGLTSLFQKVVPVESWGNRNLDGLNINLPYSVQPYTPEIASPASPHVVSNCYKGGSANRSVFIKHEMNTSMAGEVMLAWQNRSIASESQRLQMDLMARNPNVTLLNGYRARRIDMISRSTPRVRARCLTLERGNQVWFVELNTLESDTAAEQIYQRIATSAR